MTEATTNFYLLGRPHAGNLLAVQMRHWVQRLDCWAATAVLI